MARRYGSDMWYSSGAKTAALPQQEPSVKSTKKPVPPKLEHLSSLSSELAAQTRSFAKPGPPASTARSTPPFHVDEPDSLTTTGAATLPKPSQIDGFEFAAFDTLVQEGMRNQKHKEEGTPKNSKEFGANCWVDGEHKWQLGGSTKGFVSFVDRRRPSDPFCKVGPKTSDPTGSNGTRHQIQSCGGDEIAREVNPAILVASKTDLETQVEGGSSANVAAAPSEVEATPFTNVALKKTAEKCDILARQAFRQRLVLPCAPSDDEKVMYTKSGRVIMLAMGCWSYCALFVGMCWFTLRSAYFYWYGAATGFVLVYMFSQYFGVSMCGKDFNPKVHADIVLQGRVAYAPTVDVFLPVCNEPTVLLHNTWEHVRALDYPHVKVHVLDDGAQDEVKALAAEFGFQYIRRDNRPELKKAGNIRYAFARTSSEIITIFDADFCPRPDFLRETLPYLVDPSIGILQTPQFFRRREEQTWVEQGAGVCQEFFYRLIQVNLDRFNAAVCVGSCGVYRRAAVEPFGGAAPIAHSEDMFTGYKMTELGFKVKYLPLCLAMGICPDEPRTFFMQQYRWCMGMTTLVLHGDFWHSDIPRIHKLCFFNGMLCYLATAMFIFLGPTPMLLLIWIKPDEVLWFYFGCIVPAIIFGLVVTPWWSKQDSIHRVMASQRVKVLQSYASLFAIKDHLLGTAATWEASGTRSSRVSSKAYTSSVWVLVTWNVMWTVLVVGGSIWRVMVYPWYNFIIPVGFALCSCGVSLSTLYCEG